MMKSFVCFIVALIKLEGQANVPMIFPLSDVLNLIFIHNLKSFFFSFADCQRDFFASFFFFSVALFRWTFFFRWTFYLSNFFPSSQFFPSPDFFLSSNSFPSPDFFHSSNSFPSLDFFCRLTFFFSAKFHSSWFFPFVKLSSPCLSVSFYSF